MLWLEKLIMSVIKFLLRVTRPVTRLQPGAQMAEGKWHKLPLQSLNADGSRSALYLRRAPVPTRNLAIVFNGGGASWNEETTTHPTTLHSLLSGQPGLYVPHNDELVDFAMFFSPSIGILSRGKKNPFRNWNMALISYGTGDFHIGSNALPYTDADGTQKTLYHGGYQNFCESMEAIRSYFPEAEKLLITGGSAGAFAVPALAGEIVEQYPACRDVTVYSDSALAIMPEWPQVARDVWRAPEKIAAAVRSDNICADFFTALHAKYGDRLRYLFSSSTHDAAFTCYENYMRSQRFTASQEGFETFNRELKAHVARLRAENPDIAFFINRFPNGKGSSGTAHCVIDSALFWKNNENGPAACAWLCDAVNEKVYDVGMEYLS